MRSLYRVNIRPLRGSRRRFRPSLSNVFGGIRLRILSWSTKTYDDGLPLTVRNLEWLIPVEDDAEHPEWRDSRVSDWLQRLQPEAG